MANHQHRFNGIPAQPQLQQFVIDPSKATPVSCPCGNFRFRQLVRIYTVSPVMSPTGQELTATQPVLVCDICGEELKKEG